jgi:hypothetical protein
MKATVGSRQQEDHPHNRLSIFPRAKNSMKSTIDPRNFIGNFQSCGTIGGWNLPHVKGSSICTKILTVPTSCN